MFFQVVIIFISIHCAEIDHLSPSQVATICSATCNPLLHIITREVKAGFHKIADRNNLILLVLRAITKISQTESARVLGYTLNNGVLIGVHGIFTKKGIVCKICVLISFLGISLGEFRVYWVVVKSMLVYHYQPLTPGLPY